MSEEQATYQCSLSAQELRIGNWVYDGERTQFPMQVVALGKDWAHLDFHGNEGGVWEEGIKPSKLTCYVLVGFNSTKEQDLFRLRTLKELGITPFVQPYRDFNNEREPSQYEKDLARWANKQWLFKSCDFADFSPRKGFKCKEHFSELIE